ncbi:MAG: signal peptidase I [Acidobacteria bacterium]|nr:MAG: signal peptidase I [Acidobacteriota bacterium]
MAETKKAKDDKQKEGQQHSTLREYYVTTVVMTIFALFVTTYVVHPMTVPTPSMEPTIMVGDRLLIDKFTVRNSFLPPVPGTPEHEIRRGDIIVFKFPKQPEVLYVKRAIGLPGDTVEIRSKNVYINGQQLDEPYKVHSDPNVYPADPSHFYIGEGQRDNLSPVTIPPGHYFMMGDNRDDSADSRYFGLLPRDHIVGRPLIVFWSYEDERDAYLRTSTPEVLKLYAERVIYFFTRTRWSRMFRVVR